MNIPALLGILGTIIDFVRAAPQLARLLRARGAHGVSVDTAASSFLVSSGWITYGILTHQPFVSIASAPPAVIFALVTFFALRFGRKAREFKVAPFWLASLLLVGFLGGKNGLGPLLAISPLVANLPQLWVASREKNLADLSLGTWLLSFANGLTWFTYSLLQHDLSIMVSASLQLVTSGLIAVLKMRRRAEEPGQGLER